MTEINDFILPLGRNGKHSITEVIATFFLPQKILKPDRLKELKQKPHFNDFSKLDELFVQSIHLEIKKDQILQIPERTSLPAGYKFDKFDDDGLLSERISFENEESRAKIVFNCLNYESWDRYIGRLFNLMGVIKEFDKDLFIQAVGLTYIDKFKVIDRKGFIVERVFNDEKGILPYYLIQSNELFDFKLNVTQKEEIDGMNYRFLDNIEIKNGLERNAEQTLAVIHSTIPVFDNEYQYKSVDATGDFETLLNHCHNRNKEKLKILFKKEVTDFIGLTKS